MTEAAAPAKKAKKAHVWPKHPDDWYVEPRWCSTRLFERVRFPGLIWDPAAGSGRIPEAARAAGYDALATDKVSRAPGVERFNFLYEHWDFHGHAVSIVSNPPYSIADAWARRSLDIADKVALLLPLTWAASDERGRWLETTPLAEVLVLTPRPSMPPGTHLPANGKDPSGGTVDFAWFIWAVGTPAGATKFGWLRRD